MTFEAHSDESLALDAMIMLANAPSAEQLHGAVKERNFSLQNDVSWANESTSVVPLREDVDSATLLHFLLEFHTLTVLLTLD